jgi:hypothetical protein
MLTQIMLLPSLGKRSLEKAPHVQFARYCPTMIAGLQRWLHPRTSNPLELPIQFGTGEDERRGTAVRTVVAILGQVPLLE